MKKLALVALMSLSTVSFCVSQEAGAGNPVSAKTELRVSQNEKDPLQDIFKLMVESQKATALGTKEGLLIGRKGFQTADNILAGLISEAEKSAATSKDKMRLSLLASYRSTSATGLAMTFSQAQQNSEAVAALNEALPSVEKYGNAFSRGSIHNSLASNLRALNRLEEAKRHFELALAAYETKLEEYRSASISTRFSYSVCLADMGLNYDAEQQLSLLESSIAKIELEAEKAPQMQALYLYRGDFYRRLGRLAESKKDFNRYLELPQVAASPGLSFVGVMNLSIIAVNEGNEADRKRLLKQGEELLAKAREQGIDLPLHQTQLFYFARATDRLADGDLAGSLEDLEKVDELHAASGSQGFSRGANLRLSIYDLQGRLAEVLPLLEDYLSEADRNSQTDIGLKMSYARFMTDVGRFEESLALLNELIPQLKRQKSKELLTRAHLTRGDLYLQLQLLEKASSDLETAYILALEMNNPNLEVSSRLAFFSLQSQRPDFLKDDAAIKREFTRLLELTRKVGDRGKLYLLIDSYLGVIEQKSDFELREKVLAILETEAKGFSKFVEIKLEIAKSKLAREKGEFDAASGFQNLLRDRMRGEETLKLRRDLAEEILEWDLALGKQIQDDNDALVLFTNSIPQSQDLGEQLEAYLFLSRVAKQRNKAEEEFRYLDFCRIALESTRQIATNRDIRTSRSSLADQIYHRYARWYIEEGNPEYALWAAEQARGRALSSLLSRNKVMSSNPLQTRERDAFYVKKDNLERALLTAQTSSEREGLLNELRQVVIDIDMSLANAYQSEVGTLSSDKTTLYKTLQSKLGENEILLRFFTGSERSILFVIRPENTIQVVSLPGAKELNQKVERLRKSISLRERETAQYAAELRELLFSQVKGLDDFPKRLIVPDGPLYFLPMNLVLNSNSSQSTEILPTASSLRSRSNTEQELRSIVVFADPRFGSVETLDSSETDGSLGLARASEHFLDGHPKPLPGTALEAEILQQLFGEKAEVQQHLGTEASREKLLGLSRSGSLKGTQIIHLATHGFVDDAQPALSGLILSLVDEKGQAINGFLRLIDLYNLELDAELVVLSACQTGLGSLENADGLQGLYQGFLSAGAKRVLNTLWSVDDRATAFFMRAFYTRLGQGLGPELALSQAQIEMRETRLWSHPYFWAAFQVVSR